MKLRKLILIGLTLPISFSAYSLEQPYPAPQSGERLTPPIAETPSINGAKIFGATPGNPILIKIPVSGEKPVSFTSSKLPDGLTLDKNKGIISGSVKQRGTYPIKITASNSKGKTTKPISLVIGDTICLTPPMAWNSWYSYSVGVSQERMINVARLLVEKGLADHGWTYVNIDDCWQGDRSSPDKSLQSNPKTFPDMKAMCAEIHSMGLKAGIYSSPWLSTYAGFRGGSSPNEAGDYSALAIPEDKRMNPYQIFGRWPGLHQNKGDRFGEVCMMDRDAKQWAKWGFDYVKMDWLPNDVPTTKKIHEILTKSGRDIVLSLSNAAPFENMEGLSQYANLTRTSGDIHDSWGRVSGIGFDQAKWQKFTKPGHWPDPDMLQVGRLGVPNENNSSFKPSKLTLDEQMTQVSLWCLISAPLIISSDLENLDDFTLGLLTNDDMIAVNQDPSGNPAKRVIDKDGLQVWTKELSDGSTAIGFFNMKDEKKTYAVDLSKEAGIKKKSNIRDLWRRKDIGSVTDQFSIELNPHGSAVFLLTPQS